MNKYFIYACDEQAKIFLGKGTSVTKKQTDEFTDNLISVLKNASLYDNKILQYALISDNADNIILFNLLNAVKEEIISIIDNYDKDMYKHSELPKYLIEQLAINSINNFQKIKTSSNINNKKWLYMRSLTSFYIAENLNKTIPNKTDLLNTIKKSEDFFIINNSYKALSKMAEEIFIDLINNKHHQQSEFNIH